MENNIFHTYTKIKRLGDEENKDIFLNPDEQIVIEEKIDGANFRFMIKDNKIVFGSRTQELNENKEHKFQKNFNRCIGWIQDKLKDKDLSKYCGMVFYGECCVAHSMQYNWDNIPPFLGFDINNSNNKNYPKRYIPYPLNKEIFNGLGLDFVPVIKLCKAREVTNIDDSFVPISSFAMPSGTDDTRKAEGIVFKKYSFKEDSKEQIDNQIFAKYVRDKFKEINAEVFGSKRVKYNSETDVGELIFKYCTNARIDKCIFKLIDDGNKLDMTLMHKLPKMVLDDIFNEHMNEIFYSNYNVNFKELRQKVPKRCAVVLNQVITNNAFGVTNG
jgi:hypothetical protein